MSVFSMDQEKTLLRCKKLSVIELVQKLDLWNSNGDMIHPKILTYMAGTHPEILENFITHQSPTIEVLTWVKLSQKSIEMYKIAPRKLFNLNHWIKLALSCRYRLTDVPSELEEILECIQEEQEILQLNSCVAR